MFWVMPYGVEDMKVHRAPWISIAVAAICFLVFGVTHLAGTVEEAIEPPIEAVLAYHADHPWLELPADFRERFFVSAPPRGDVGIAGHDVVAEQTELNRLAAEAVAVYEAHPFRRLALVPARGFAQVGWLTHVFVHGGWMHLLGNLFFFYLVGPLLEDAWGRRWFAALFVIGGLIATVDVALNPVSLRSHVGASGAVAAVMGAFTFKFAARKVKLAYFWWIFVRVRAGVFAIPAWLWGGLWFLSELFDFLVWGITTGVNFFAHVAGFGFGFAAAAVFKVTGQDRRTAEAVEAQYAWTRPPALERAEAALANGDVPAARTHFREVLAKDPNQADALLGLAQLELQSGLTAAGMAHAEKLLSRQVLADDGPSVVETVEVLGPKFDPTRLKPALAFRVANFLDQGPEGLRPRAEPIFLAAAAVNGPLAAKALVRAAEVKLREPEGAGGALAYLERAKGIADRPADLEGKLDALLAEVEARMPAPTEPASVRPPVDTISCRLHTVTDAVLELVNAQGKVVPLPVTRLRAIAVGVIAGERNLLLTDLVTDWGVAGGQARAARLTLSDLQLGKHLPGLAPREAYPALLRRIHEASGASLHPDAAAIKAGRYGTYPDRAAFERAVYDPEL